MIFQTLPQVLAGSKTQTRRLVQPKQVAVRNKRGEIMRVERVLRDGRTRLQWAVGRTYAVQPGRGELAVARVRLTGIRCEQLQDITEEDAWAEGFKPTVCPVCGGSGNHFQICGACNGTGINASGVYKFALVWNRTHTRKGTRWDDNPCVWVLGLKLVDVKWYLLGGARNDRYAVSWDFVGDELFVIVRDGKRIVEFATGLTEEKALDIAEMYGVRSALLHWLHV